MPSPSEILEDSPSVKEDPSVYQRRRDPSIEEPSFWYSSSEDVVGSGTAGIQSWSLGAHDVEASTLTSGIPAIQAPNTSDTPSAPNIGNVETTATTNNNAVIDNDDDPPPEYNSPSNLDMPPAYTDLSGPPFCYGFMNQGRSFLAPSNNSIIQQELPSYSSRSPRSSRHNCQSPLPSTFLGNGMRLYFVPPAPVNVDSTQRVPRNGYSHNRNGINLEGGFNEDISENNNTVRPTNATTTPISHNISCVVALIFWLFMPIAAFLIGVQNLDMCPVESNIPVFLIIAGIVLLSRGMFFSYSRKQNNLENAFDCSSTMGAFLDVFTIFWIFVGSFWVFSVIAKVNFEPMSEMNENHCNKTLFIFTLWFLVAFYILFLMAWFFVIICICLYLTERKQVRQQRRLQRRRRNELVRMRASRNLDLQTFHTNRIERFNRNRQRLFRAGRPSRGNLANLTLRNL